MQTVEYAKSVSAKTLALTPKIHPAIQSFLGDRQMLQELVRALGSPLNVLFPELVSHNVDAFNHTFEKHSIRGSVYFAHKCNQSNSLTRQLAICNAKIDVSSINELRHALSSGFTGDRIEATGPKNTEFIGLAIQHGVTISIDSIAELQQVLNLQRLINASKSAQVLIRLSGFEAEHSRFLNKGSRFGIPIADLDQVFALLTENRHLLNFLGFAFHLDTVSVLERSVAIENCVHLFERALQLDLEPRVLNIGGGYKVNYLSSEEHWNNYTSALKEGVLGTGPSLTWQGNSFGLHADKGKLRGNFNSYNYFDKQTGSGFLDELLEQTLPDLSASAGNVLRDNMIELWIEPGRSLVDQTGITVARVNSTRPSSRGDELVCLDMKRQDISFLDQEIFIDPVMLYQDQSEGEPAEVYFAGNLCLESDLIYRHKTFLPKRPQPGDLAVFVNTSGYFMDFSASTSIMQPVARKIAVCERNEQYHWFLDEQYSPFWTMAQ